ncbi:thiamine pyrophosphate-dependent dehydrogenase E1 component subunit alpha [Maridesulfovibrio sp.]|uniref:thiamine pyrophosphate-dependent dehydrogenase E1 component subunit alpha n=1 Tax=Maridesulfovibrio sp. TaxID=2795000 RepID=UPI002A18A18F|nr:thiamine pyrophosphate-dependent dehydrogenase E1 component subunit alpha [Maridesulfovibrio sp.]
MKPKYFEGYKQDNALYDFLWMLLIRRAEEKIKHLFSEGLVDGTTHLYIGQEANAVGILQPLSNEHDFVISNHRCHGHFLAFGGTLEELFGEVMGRVCGASKGFGGSQHIKGKNFFSSGIQGGFTPIACGLAYGIKLKQQDGVVVCCIGDGTLGEGVLYESMNIAALKGLPILYLVENNRYAQSTPTQRGVAGSMIERGKAFSLNASEIDSHDVGEIKEWGQKLIETTRKNSVPTWAVIHTHRLCAHSKGDDTRSQDEIYETLKFDPLDLYRTRLDEKKTIEAENIVADIIESAIEKTMTKPSPVIPQDGV